VAINRKTGEYDTFRRWKVFADDSTELEFPEKELRFEDALDVTPDAEVGATSRRARVRRVRAHRRADGEAGDRAEGARGRARAGRRAVPGRMGTLVSGIVKRVDRNGIFVDLGGNARASSRASR